MTRSHRLRQNLQPPKLAIRVTTAAIVLLGVVALIWVFSPTERQRQSRLEALEVGADPAQLATLLGADPVRCPTGSLEHLMVSFPEGWAPAAIDVTLERLREATRERWLFSLDPDEAAACGDVDHERTEVGIGPDQRVLWYVSVTGRSSLVLPAGYVPTGAPVPD